VHRIIHFIEDHELPRGQSWALIQTTDSYHFFVKRSKVTQDVLEEGWIAYEGLAWRRGQRDSA
jgi:hypothetical protein